MIILFSFKIYSLNSIGIQRITSENFEQEVEKSLLPVFVNLFATWCPNCKRLESLITEVLGDFNGRCFFGAIDIDKNQDFLQNLLQEIFEKHLYIMSGFPCVLVFYKGVFKKSFLGFFVDQQDLSKTLNETLVSLGY
jgi:thioredoxin 1